MPLDVKPLSPLRRVTMVAVMFGLLAGSLGFANYLVWRDAHPPVGSVVFPPPPGYPGLAKVNRDSRRIGPRPLEYCIIPNLKTTRRYALFLFEDFTNGDASAARYVQVLFNAMMMHDEEQELPVVEAMLEGLPALQAERTYGAEIFGEPNPDVPDAPRPSSFAILRLTIVNDEVVAVGFSGAGKLTPADRQSFDEYCKSINLGAGSTGPQVSPPSPRRR